MSQRAKEESVKELMYQVIHIILEDGDRGKDAWICYLEVILMEQKAKYTGLRNEWSEQQTTKQASIFEKEKLG